MTAITDTRKRSRDEDTCDFMPISKRINNLTLTSQSLGEQEPSLANNGNGNGAAAAAGNHHFMATNTQEIQTQHFAQHSLVSYPNGMSHHFLNQHGQSAQNSNYHQSHIVQSTNHSNGFHNNSHLALGTNVHKQNHNHQAQQHQPPSQHHHHHQQQHEQHQQNHTEPNNNQVEEVYRPDLTPDENPFYYDKNKLLFDLHVERERRHQSH